MDPRSKLDELFARDDLDETEKRARLFELVYGELRGMAGRQLRAERGSHTLQPTALVNEVYLRLGGEGEAWSGRPHFFGAAAQAMRRILIDHARERRAQKRGGDLQRVTMADIVGEDADGALDVLALNDALDLLEEEDMRLARVVQLRFFIGLSIEETAVALEVSEMTVKRDWRYARAWLVSRMELADD